MGEPVAVDGIEIELDLSEPSVADATLIEPQNIAVETEIMDITVTEGGYEIKAPMPVIGLKANLPVDIAAVLPVAIDAPAPVIGIRAYGTWSFDVPSYAVSKEIYICRLHGAAGTFEIPVASFQIRRRITGFDYMEAIIPYTQQNMDLLLSSSWYSIEIYKGMVFKSGAVNLSRIGVVDYENMAYDRGANNASIRISGSKEASYTTSKPVDLKGVSIVSYQANGKRRVRCEVDYLAQPNDTVRWNGSHMTADIITIAVGRTASMDITEA